MSCKGLAFVFGNFVDEHLASQIREEGGLITYSIQVATHMLIDPTQKPPNSWMLAEADKLEVKVPNIFRFMSTHNFQFKDSTQIWDDIVNGTWNGEDEDAPECVFELEL